MQLILTFYIPSLNSVSIGFAEYCIQVETHLCFIVKQVFPQLDFMGWYSLGSKPAEADLKIHEQVKSRI
jgi:COP9 signalosome complex subunit 6